MSSDNRKNFYDYHNNPNYVKLLGKNEPSFVYTSLFMSILELIAIFKNHPRLNGLGNRFIKCLQDSESFDSEPGSVSLSGYITTIIQKVSSSSSVHEALYFAHWYCDQEESYPFYARSIKAILFKEFYLDLQIKQKIFYNNFDDIKKYLLKISQVLEICINYSIDESFNFEKCGQNECPNIFLVRWSNGSFWVVYHRSMINFFTSFQESELDTFPFIHINPYLPAINPVTSSPAANSSQVYQTVQINPPPVENSSSPLSNSSSDSLSKKADEIIQDVKNLEIYPKMIIPENKIINIPDPLPQKKLRPFLNLSQNLSQSLADLKLKMNEPRKKNKKKRNFEKKARPVLNFEEKIFIKTLKINHLQIKKSATGEASNQKIIENINPYSTHKDPYKPPQNLPKYPTNESKIQHFQPSPIKKISTPDKFANKNSSNQNIELNPNFSNNPNAFNQNDERNPQVHKASNSFSNPNVFPMSALPSGPPGNSQAANNINMNFQKPGSFQNLNQLGYIPAPPPGLPTGSIGGNQPGLPGNPLPGVNNPKVNNPPIGPPNNFGAGSVSNNPNGNFPNPGFIPGQNFNQNQFMNNNPNMQNLLMVPQGYSPGLTILNDQNPGIVNNPPAVGHQGYNPGFSTILNNQITGNVINPPGMGHQGYNPGFTVLNNQNPGIVNNPPAVGHQGYNTGFSTILNNQIPGNVINPPGIGHQGYSPDLGILNNHNIGAVNAPPGMTPGTVMINPNSPAGQNNPGMNVGTMMFKTGIPYGMTPSNQFK